jgi:PAS domain S-box-containing protein
MKDEKQHLVTQYAVTRALAESASLDEAAPKILEAVCEGLGWELGALWVVDSQTDALRCIETWHKPVIEVAEFGALSRERTFARGEGLPGRVWESMQPAWIEDVATNGNFPRTATARRAGLHGAMGFPILLGTQPLGVMEFFSREVLPPDAALLDMMASLGSQTGQFIERKRAEEALRESEEQYRVVAETASDAIITIDTESRIVFINPAAEEVFGYALSEMLGQELTMLMPDYMRHLHRAGLQRYEETNQRHISWDGVELPGLHKDGHEVPLEISFSEFVRRGKRYFTGIARDITERKRAAAEKEQSEGRYRALSDAMPQLVWATDADGSHFYYNQRWYEYTGLTEEESMGFGFANALHPEDKERTLQCWRRAWRDGEAYEIEYRFYSRPRDEYRWFLGRATPVRDAAGKITQWVGTCTDIEEQKHMETSLARINRERTQMLEEVSTPVVPVWRGVLVMPLIGSLDTERMNRAMQAALGEVTRTGARACIIDITGARIVDSHAIANLSNLVSSLKLIGAEAIVTGVTAQVAKSLVKLGVDFTGMRTSRTLAQALSRWIKANGLTTDTTQNRVSSNGTGTESR